MYIICPECGNDTFRITTERIAVCTSCGSSFEICIERKPLKPELPEPPEPLPPRKPEKIWFK